MLKTIKKVFFVGFLLAQTIASSQTITTTAGTINSCPGTITIPVNVTNFNDVASISLTLEYSETMMNYTGYINTHPQLTNGTLLINGTNNKVIISWFSLNPLNIGSTKLIELEFDYIKDNADLRWDTATSGNCQYSDSNLNDKPADFIDGGVISSLTKPKLIFPQDQSIEIPLNSIFKWSSCSCSPSYRLQISKDSVFSDIVVAATAIFDTSYSVSNLQYNTAYWWRTKASISQQTSAWSDSAKFITKDPPGIFENNTTNSNLKLSISPNPITDQANILFELPEPGLVNLSFYDLSGRLAFKYSNETKYNKGSQTISENLSVLPAGIYLCEIQAQCADKIYLQRKKLIVIGD